jgi:hypothetical protein
MLANISEGHDTNINIFDTIQVFGEAWKTLSAATGVHCFHITRILPQDVSEIEPDSDHTVKTFQHSCQNLGTEVGLDDFICGNNNAIAAGGQIGRLLLEILM